MNGISAVANILRREGTEYLFVFPFHHLIEPAVEQGIRPILARTERTVITMADGYSRVTDGRRSASCAVQDGPGIENAFGGVAQAYADSNAACWCCPAGPPGAHRPGPGVRRREDLSRHHQVGRAHHQRRAHPRVMRRAFT